MKIARTLRRQPEFVEIFELKTFFYLFVKIIEQKTFSFWSSPCSFDPHWNKFFVSPCPSRIHINNFPCPPQIYFCPPSHAILAPGMEIGRSPRNRESPTKSGKLTGILVGTVLYITYLQIYLNLKFVVIKNRVKIENAYRVHYSFFV